MKRLAQVIIPAVFLVLLLTSAAWANPTVVDVVPSALTVDPAANEEFTIAVYISSDDIDLYTKDLYAFSFDMKYDPQVVKVVALDGSIPDSGNGDVVSGGVFLGQDTNLNYDEGVLNKFNNVTGKLEYAEFLIGEVPGVNVSGRTLAATFKFRAVGEGQVHLRFANCDDQLDVLGIDGEKPTVLVKLLTSEPQNFEYPAMQALTIRSTTTPALIGDFNNDGKIDFEDLMIFSLAWQKTSLDNGWSEALPGVAGSPFNRADIGPMTGGVAPSLSIAPDGKVDFEDLMVFALMWSWARN